MWIKIKNLKDLGSNLREGLLDIKTEILELKKDVYKKEKYPLKINSDFKDLDPKIKKILKTILELQSQGYETNKIEKIIVSDKICSKSSFYNVFRSIKYYQYIKSLYEEIPIKKQ